jgi:uncharacterized protein YgfB (UPF0149 family)
VTGRELAERHIGRFNAGMRSGDWEPMLAGFADDAKAVFPHATHRGLAAIRAAYRERPPDDEIRPLGIQENDERTVVVGFAWLRGGTGRLTLEHDRGLVTRLAVVLDE